LLKITAPGFVLLVLFNVSEDAPLQWRKQHCNVYVTCRPKTTTGDVDRRVVMWGTKDLNFSSPSVVEKYMDWDHRIEGWWKVVMIDPSTLSFCTNLKHQLNLAIL